MFFYACCNVCVCCIRLKEVQASDKAEMQSLQKQIKDLQSGNTTLQIERDRLSEELQVREYEPSDNPFFSPFFSLHPYGSGFVPSYRY